jgi:pimeloyl-ACP methyl ester carboxylesterase
LKHFTASDGVRIAYEDEGAGRPLVLLHGLMAHSGFFAKQRALASEFRLIGFDLRGHGRSLADGTAPTIEQLADDVSEIAEALELEQAIAVGWSLGAPVLWHVLCGRAAGRFAGAVVVDMTPRVLNDEEWQLGLSEEMCEARRSAIREDFANFALGAGQAMFAQPVREEHRALANWAGEEFARNDPTAIGALWSSLVEQDFRPVLGRIRQPTLVIHGAQSQLYGSDTARHLVSALPNARAIQFDRSGHAPQLEQPDLFNATIRDFAATLPRVRVSKTTA